MTPNEKLMWELINKQAIEICKLAACLNECREQLTKETPSPERLKLIAKITKIFANEKTT